MTLGLFYFLEFAAIFVLLGWSIYLVFKNGQLNNMPIATMAVGAYLYGYLSRDLGWPFILCFFAAILAAALLSFMLALGLARAPAFSMTIATIAMIFITQTVIKNLKVVGGDYGFHDIPRVDNLIWITAAIVLIIGFFIFRLEKSKIGRGIDTVFVDRDVARTLGVNTYWLSLGLQVASGVIGAIAGVLFAMVVRNITPKHFSFSMLLSVYCFYFVGGSSTMWGILVFAPILWGFPLLLPENIAAWKDTIYGMLLIIIMIARPEGIITKKWVGDISLKITELFRNKRKRVKE